MRYLYSIMFALLLLGGAEAKEERLTGIYSSMVFNKESGDLLGIEVFIVHSQDGYQVVFQDAEGAPSIPLVVPLRIVGSEIKFTIPDRRGYSGPFVGQVKGNRLIGHFENGAVGPDGKRELILVKKKSYWQ